MDMPFYLENVSHRYSDGTLALEDVTMSMKRGERIALLGPNGSGKTTLLLHLNGILKPTSGKVHFDGKPVEYSSKALLELRRRVGFVFQDPNDQLFAPTVRQDVAFGPLNLGQSAQEVRRVVEEALDTVGMAEYAEKPPHFLSFGQKKRVALAGVLAMQPEVIIMDEPTSNLDPRGTSEILHLLLRLSRERRISLILATHDVDMVPLFADRLYILNKGRVVSEGTPRELFSDTQLIRSVNLRSPRITHLFEVLRKEDGVPVDERLPLTIGEARREVLRLLGILQDDLTGGSEVVSPWRHHPPIKNKRG
ncbi:MAG: ATP-binding cassette domain-containing protein [Candidatus Verstraetearchaeota archaeon]|nr:ATP-binding cassette domain-containing protein [Candidatus Verstraetearchaeota archaeon]